MATQTFTAPAGTAGAEFLKDLAERCNTLKASTPASGWEQGLEDIIGDIFPTSAHPRHAVEQVYADLGADVVTPGQAMSSEPPYMILNAIESSDPKVVASVYYVALNVGRGILGLGDGPIDDNAHSPGASQGTA